MADIHLFFYGSDFTQLRKEKNQFITKFENKKGKKIVEKVEKIKNDDLKQFNILEAFLKFAQINLSNLIIDKDEDIEKNKLYDYHNHQMYFGGLVGVISAKDFVYENEKYDITLQINTRLDSYKKGDPQTIKPYFLMTLLFSGFVPLNSSKVNNDSEGLTDMLLLYSFYEKLNKAKVKGYFKTYHRFEKNDDRLKGAIDVTRHIKNNMGLTNGKISYSYKEKSENNYINHLIISSYEHLKKKYFNLTNNVFNKNLNLKNSLETLKHFVEFPKYSNKTLIAKNLYPLSHPFYTEYEDLRKVCLKVLRDEKISLFNGDKADQVDGALMYVPTLWERYIEQYLRGKEVSSQDKIYVLNVNKEDEYKQLTIPDFVFYKDDKPFMILDAKFKPGWISAAQKGYMGTLLLADYDKCIRDMVSINSHACGVIFPTNLNVINQDETFKIDDKEYYYEHEISKYNKEDRFYTFPISVPPLEDVEFRDWKEKFESNFKETIEKVYKLINSINVLK